MKKLINSITVAHLLRAAFSLPLIFIAVQLMTPLARSQLQTAAQQSLGLPSAPEGNSSSTAGPSVVSAVSRKTHGIAGTFDIDLLAVPPVTECRSGGATGDYTMVVTFDQPVTVPGAEVICGTGSVSSVSISGAVVTILLTGIPQLPCGGYIVHPIIVRLNQVNGTTDFTIPMGVLIGDVNTSGFVNATDTIVWGACIPPVDQTNFRCDINADGQFDSTDKTLVICYSGSGLFPDPNCP